METVGCGGGCSFVLVYNVKKQGRVLYLPDTFADCYSKEKGFKQNDIFLPKKDSCFSHGRWWSS